MTPIVKSSFSIASRQFGGDFLEQEFPWRVVEVAPAGKVDFHVVFFDLGIGEHDRVDSHLIAAKAALLKHEAGLDSLSGDCTYALWVKYRFPPKDGAINISPSLSAAFGLLRVELIFHLAAHD